MDEFRSGNGAAWLDLLATVNGRYRPVSDDAIETPAALRAWLSANAMEPTSAVTDGDVRQFQTIREALHHLAAASVRGEPMPTPDVRLLTLALQGDRALNVRRHRDGLAIGRPATAAEALGRLARSAVHDLSDRYAPQLRACGDDTCSGIFLDPTGRRRWCSDERCGNRMRVRAHRAQRARTQQP
ncbi:MAG TPA: CGNR zinc finger domain-containing protein [Frankiaceae bacterium]|nr:CGNR zinc finger domain-containing protein [Frankiaceae bacterium]